METKKCFVIFSDVCMRIVVNFIITIQEYWVGYYRNSNTVRVLCPLESRFSLGALAKPKSWRQYQRVGGAERTGPADFVTNNHLIFPTVFIFSSDFLHHVEHKNEHFHSVQKIDILISVRMFLWWKSASVSWAGPRRGCTVVIAVYIRDVSSCI